MNINQRCELCGFTHHFYNEAGSCRAFGVKTYGEKKIEELRQRAEKAEAELARLKAEPPNDERRP